MQIDRHREPKDLLPRVRRVFDISAGKLLAIEDSWKPEDGAPVFTVEGKYRARGWTEWTQGFQFGSAILQFDATGDQQFLDVGRDRTLTRMSPHLTHMGVHDQASTTSAPMATCGGWRARNGSRPTSGRSGSTSSRSR